MVKTIKYQPENGEEISVKYDNSALHKWSVMKALSSGSNTFQAWDKILCGKSDEVAEKLGDSMDEMQELLNRITLIESDAKN